MPSSSSSAQQAAGGGVPEQQHQQEAPPHSQQQQQASNPHVQQAHHNAHAHHQQDSGASQEHSQAHSQGQQQHPHPNHGNAHQHQHQHQQQPPPNAGPGPEQMNQIPIQRQDPMEMSPIFQSLILVLVLYATHVFLKPVLTGLRDYFRPEKKVDKEALRSRRNEKFSAKADAIRDGFAGAVESVFRVEDLTPFVEAHCQALKRIGLGLITEDPNLNSFHTLAVLLDNCLIKGMTSFPAKSEGLRKQLLQFEHGERMLNLCAFYLQEAHQSPTTASPSPTTASTTSIKDKVASLQNKIKQEQSFYVFEESQRLQALTARCCIQYCLDISKAKGTRRWLQVDPKILIPDDLSVVPRDLLFMYSHPARVLQENADRTAKPAGDWAGATVAGVGEREKQREAEFTAEVQEYYLPAAVGGGKLHQEDEDDIPEVERLSQKERNLENSIQENVMEAILLGDYHLVQQQQQEQQQQQQYQGVADDDGDEKSIEQLQEEELQHCKQQIQTSHSLSTDFARLWVQRRRDRFRKELFESQKLAKPSPRDSDSDVDACGNHPISPTSADRKKRDAVIKERQRHFQALADHRLMPPNVRIAHFHWEGEIPHAFGLQSSQGGSKSSSSGANDSSSSGNKNTGPQRSAGGRDSKKNTSTSAKDKGNNATAVSTLAGAGRSKANATQVDVAMRQIALEAIPQWKCCPEVWEDTRSLRNFCQILTVGAALDYTNNRGFVCCVMILGRSLSSGDFHLLGGLGTNKNRGLPVSLGSTTSNKGVPVPRPDATSPLDDGHGMMAVFNGAKMLAGSEDPSDDDEEDAEGEGSGGNKIKGKQKGDKNGESPSTTSSTPGKAAASASGGSASTSSGSKQEQVEVADASKKQEQVEVADASKTISKLQYLPPAAGILSCEYGLDPEVQNIRERLVTGRSFKPEDNPYHYKNVKNNSPWAQMSFGAKVNDKNGQATMRQKSGF
ncbi:unnamed protein product [Amoebophrya sp. A25]|nr:unnamed protein product [Amoebophrya sp. A25]|eukprot:GSA25T00010044001.1